MCRVTALTRNATRATKRTLGTRAGRSRQVDARLPGPPQRHEDEARRRERCRSVRSPQATRDRGCGRSGLRHDHRCRSWRSSRDSGARSSPDPRLRADTPATSRARRGSRSYGLATMDRCPKSAPQLVERATLCATSGGSRNIATNTVPTQRGRSAVEHGEGLRPTTPPRSAQRSRHGRTCRRVRPHRTEDDQCDGALPPRPRRQREIRRQHAAGRERLPQVVRTQRSAAPASIRRRVRPAPVHRRRRRTSAKAVDRRRGAPAGRAPT